MLLCSATQSLQIAVEQLRPSVSKVRNSIVLCNSASVDRCGMAAPRFLAAAAACVTILLSCAAEIRKS